LASLFSFFWEVVDGCLHGATVTVVMMMMMIMVVGVAEATML
jgi:hypothetical protein